MSTTESVDRAPAKANMPETSLIPGEETAWEKYAPNGEPVISGVGSFTIHAIALGVVLMGLVMLFRGSSSPDVDSKIPLVVVKPDGDLGGGKGHQDASSNVPGVPSDRKDITSPLIPKTAPSLDGNKPTDDSKVNIGPSKSENDKPFIDPDQFTRPKNPRTQETLDKLKAAFSNRRGPGMKGPGTDGGGDGGDGGGFGKDKGPGTGLDPTSRRLARWELVFPKADALHYLQQLEALGAIIAVTDRQNRIMTIRNLHERPAKPAYEIVNDADRIYWVDDREESTEAISQELELDFVPGAIVAFFPKSLEEELLRKELAYRGLAENDILRTRFSITFHGGQHVIRVTDQQSEIGRAAK